MTGGPNAAAIAEALAVSHRDGKVLLRCFAGCSQGEVIAALRERGLWPRGGASNGQHRREGRRPVGERRWDIPLGHGMATHVRIDFNDGSKAIHWERDGKLGLGGVKVEDLPLYSLPELLAAPPGALVVVVEGEKAADALGARGVLAVGTVTGAAATPSQETLRPLLGRQIILWPDADDAGRSHMSRVAERLWSLGHREIAIVDWREAPDRGDAADFPGDGEALAALLEAA